MATTYNTVADLAAALRRAVEAHHLHEQEVGQDDPDWPDWCAQYMADEQAGNRDAGRAAPDA